MAFGALCGTWNEPRMDSPQYAIASKTTLRKFSTLTRHPQIAEPSEPSKATGSLAVGSFAVAADGFN